MPPARPPRRRLLEERGRITWVTLLLLLCVAAAVYLVWVWAPIYVVNYEVKQVVRDYCNQAVKNKEDATLVAAMLHKFRTLDYEWKTNELGKQVKVPIIDLQPRDILWERSDDPSPTLHVAFEYVRVVRYPFIDVETEARMPIDITMDITVPDWGPTR
jgi:hypothetical protein